MPNSIGFYKGIFLLVIPVRTIVPCWKRSIFRKVTGCNNFLQLSMHFKKMTNSIKQVLETYLEIRILCAIQYIAFQKQSVGGALKVLEKSLKTVLDEVYLIVNLNSFSLSLNPPPPLDKLTIALVLSFP